MLMGRSFLAGLACDPPCQPRLRPAPVIIGKAAVFLDGRASWGALECILRHAPRVGPVRWAPVCLDSPRGEPDAHRPPAPLPVRVESGWKGGPFHEVPRGPGDATPFVVGVASASEPLARVARRRRYGPQAN